MDSLKDEEIIAALRRLARATDVPPVDAAREAALLGAFDRHMAPDTARRQAGVWWLPAFSGAVALLVSIVAWPGTSGRHATPPPGVPASATVGNFIPWPGASSLPPLESGELVRMDLPVWILPSLGIAPPAGHVNAVKADVVIGQDGLARAVRFVGK